MQFGLDEFTEAFAGRDGGQLDVFLVTLSLMLGTAGLPHVIIRFYTTKTVRGARYPAFWALLFISLLYLTAPAVGAFTKLNLLRSADGSTANDLPDWIAPWEEAGYVTLNSEGVIETVSTNEVGSGADLIVSNDILVLASPEISGLPAPIIGLMAAGGMAAALSTAAGLMLVISSAVSHDIYFRMIAKEQASEKTQMRVGRLAMAAAVIVAIFAGLNPPAFVAQVVAFAFGLGASTFFPILILGNLLEEGQRHRRRRRHDDRSAGLRRLHDLHPGAVRPAGQRPYLRHLARGCGCHRRPGELRGDHSWSPTSPAHRARMCRRWSRRSATRRLSATSIQ